MNEKMRVGKYRLESLPSVVRGKRVFNLSNGTGETMMTSESKLEAALRAFWEREY